MNNPKRKSLFVDGDKSDASILHALTISLSAAIWMISAEKEDHLTLACDRNQSSH